MKKSDKITVLTLVIIVCMGFGGCTVNLQAGKTNSIVNNRKQKELTFQERYPEGRSIQQFIKDQIGGQNDN